MLVRPARSGATRGTRSPKRPDPQDLRQHVLQGAVAAVHDEQVDLLAGQLGQGLGHHPRVLGLHVEHVGVAPQEAEHAGDLFLVLARAQIVDDTDSQVGSDLSVSEAGPAWISDVPCVSPSRR